MFATAAVADLAPDAFLDEMLPLKVAGQRVDAGAGRARIVGRMRRCLCRATDESFLGRDRRAKSSDARYPIVEAPTSTP
jgi:hypothetical protein